MRFARCDASEAPLYFIHIPKTAGVSVDRVINQVFEKDSICPPYLWSEILSIPQEKLDTYKLFRGHFYSSLGLLVDKPFRCITFMRDPLERALSHYGHVLRAPDHYLHARAHELGSLEAYLRDPVTRETVSNFHAKCFAQQLNPVEVASKLTTDEMAELKLERMLETAPAGLSNEELLRQSKEFLDAMCMVGITEQFKESIWLLTKTFAWKIEQTDFVENVNQSRVKLDDITPVEQDLLRELNAVDLELYDYAKKLFRDQLEAQQKKLGVMPPRFVSYAQNFEDVMLWRALKDVPAGFYIDIGANDPVVDSVSYAFYSRGWRGIHVEPVPVFAKKIRAARPEETVIEAAVNDKPGELSFFDIPGTGMSTGRENIVSQHSESGFTAKQITVPTITLAEILKKSNGREIHWLKIDIEGMEEVALKSWEQSAARPWIVVIESVLPNSTETNFSTWESHLLERGYNFVYFDGLNRFYLHDSQQHLRSRFDAPPNILDNVALTENSGFARELAEKIAMRDAKIEALLNKCSLGLRAPLRRIARRLISLVK